MSSATVAEEAFPGKGPREFNDYGRSRPVAVIKVERLQWQLPP